MKNIALFLFALVSFSLSSYGQISPQEERANMPAIVSPYIPKDTSKIDCIYQYEVTDTNLQEKRDYYMILELGDSICKFEDYSRYRLDSAFIGSPTVVTNRGYDILYRKYNPQSSEAVMTYLNSQKLDCVGRVFIDNFTYIEPIPAINWQFTDSTKVICGYQCKKATCSFRGYKWTAWYSDIPKSVGPWKLSGLPGLILEATTEEKDHHFIATTIRKSNNVILYQKRDYFKTTRERFNKALARYRNNPGGSWNNSPLAPKDMDGKVVKVPRRKLFFNPLEKE